MRTFFNLTYMSVTTVVLFYGLLAIGVTALIYMMGDYSCRKDNFRNTRTPICKGSAALGNPVASYFVATDYHFGVRGYDKDLARAVSEYRYAAEHGVAAAQHNLGEMLLTGDGATQDTIGGLKLLLSAAEAAEPITLHRLALLLFNPKEGPGYLGGALNQQAIDLYIRAALKGYVPSVFALGLIYFFGVNAEADEERGLTLINAAYEAGYEPAEEFVEAFKARYPILADNLSS